MEVRRVHFIRDSPGPTGRDLGQLPTERAVRARQREGGTVAGPSSGGPDSAALHKH